MFVREVAIALTRVGAGAKGLGDGFAKATEQKKVAPIVTTKAVKNLFINIKF